MAPLARLLRETAFKQQLNVVVAVGVFCLALFSSLLTSWQGSRQIRDTLLGQGTRIAENLASQSALALLYASADNASEAVNTTLSFPDVRRVEIRNSSGRPLIVRGDPAPDAADAPLPGASPAGGFLEAETGDSWRFVAPVRSRAADSPFDVVERKDELLGFVRVVQSKDTLSRMLAQIFLTNVAISLLFAAAFLFVLHWLAARLTQPITELSEAMARAERGDENVSAQLSGPRDIRDMAKAFNRMIAALVEREQALRESQASYREVVDSVKEVIFQTNAAGEWVLLNPAWQEITGIEIDDALGHPLADFLHEEDRPTAALWQSRLARGEVHRCHFEARVSRRDGGIAWLEVSQRARRDADDRFAGSSGTLDDITERKLAAEKLEQLNQELENRVRVRTAQLEASNRELEAFSYSVSHDLRAPLRAIDGFARIIEEDYAEKLDEAGRGYLERVRHGSQHMSHLIDDLLKLARLSRAPLDSRQTDLSAMAREIVAELREAEPERRNEVTIDDGLVAHADPVLARVALENLLRNAWKYSSRRDVTRVTFTAEVRPTAGGEEIVYCLRDNGAGFDMAYADKLFRPFSRLHSNDEFSGTGIGLATVQRVIHRHGGRIWAEAKVDGGAAFYFTLPEPKE